MAVVDVSVGRILEAGDLERRNASLSGAAGETAAGMDLKGDGRHQQHGIERGPSDSDEGSREMDEKKGAARGNRGAEVY